jgi:hypothetical protein
MYFTLLSDLVYQSHIEISYNHNKAAVPIVIIFLIYEENTIKYMYYY